MYIFVHVFRAFQGFQGHYINHSVLPGFTESTAPVRSLPQLEIAVPPDPAGPNDDRCSIV